MNASEVGQMICRKGASSRLVLPRPIVSRLVSSISQTQGRMYYSTAEQNRTEQDRTKHLVAQHSPRNGSNNGDGSGKTCRDAPTP